MALWLIVLPIERKLGNAAAGSLPPNDAVRSTQKVSNLLQLFMLMIRTLQQCCRVTGPVAEAWLMFRVCVGNPFV
jgi:hypothetical protein